MDFARYLVKEEIDKLKAYSAEELELID